MKMVLATQECAWIYINVDSRDLCKSMWMYTILSTQKQFQATAACVLVNLKVQVNGWQLAKMKKSIPDMSLP